MTRIAYLQQAAERDPTHVGAMRGLVEMYRSSGKLEEALDMAKRVGEARPGDVIAAIDVAELCLELGRLDEASAAFGRLLDVDDEPEHEVYAYHGMIEVEARRERWRRALDLAVDCTRVDRLGRTTDILAFVVAQVFGEEDRPAPPRDGDRRGPRAVAGGTPAETCGGPRWLRSQHPQARPPRRSGPGARRARRSSTTSA